MNPLLGTLMLFSAILITFFGLPVAGLFIMSRISPANLNTATPITMESFDTLQPKETPQPVSMPITIKKIRHKGNYIWVDA